MDEDSARFDAVAADETASEESTGFSRFDDQAPVVEPPVSAFRWGNAGNHEADAREERLVKQDDREPGETWVQRAYRGPSALNPSASLKTRLKRAAFFDKRERDASAGRAEPLDPTAGLPERMIEQNHESELA